MNFEWKIISDLGLNIFLILSLGYLYSLFFNKIKINNIYLKYIINGLLYALVGMVSMSEPFTIEVSKGFIVDGRTVIVAISAAYGGPIQGSTTGLILIIYRILIGGIGVLIGIVNIIISILSGLYFFYSTVKKGKLPSIIQLFLMGVLVSGLPIIATILTIPLHSNEVLRIIKIAGPVILILFPPAAILLGYLLNTTIKEYRIKQELIESQKNLRNALADKEILIKEIYHRTNNNMQVINSLLSLQLNQNLSSESKNIITNTSNRIQTMALAHNMLYKAEDLSNVNFKDYIHELSMVVIQSYDIDISRIKINLEIDNIIMLFDYAVPLGLVMNELISNSIKHAFENSQGGNITIKSFRDESGKIILDYSDNGKGISDDIDLKNRETIGFRIIRSILEYQFNGLVEFDNSDGFKCHIEFFDKAYEERV